MSNHKWFGAALLGVGMWAGLPLVGPVTAAHADCAEVHVWIDREGVPPQDVVNQCPATPCPTIFDVYEEGQRTGTVPAGDPDGAGVFVGVVACPPPAPTAASASR